MRRMYSKPQLLEAVEQEAEVNGLKAFENIVDKDGHKRFIEEDITPETISGITWNYAKWSLSGTHLMIVVAGNIANATSLSSGAKLFDINIPSWIFDKIYPILSTHVSFITQIFYGESATTQNATIRLSKQTTLNVNMGQSFTLTADRTFRIAIDLLIDNE